ncbi:MAG: PilZ domain-containing protein [Bryobacteraceae bacterium]
MDRRGEARYPARRDVRVRVLSDPEEVLAGALCEVSASGTRLLVEKPLAVGTPLEIEQGEWSWLGEVCYCQRLEQGYAVGVRVRHSLTVTEDLLRLARQLRLEQGVAAEKQTE